MSKYKIGSSTVAALAFATTMELTVSESRTIVPIAMTDDATINLASDAEPSIGDELIVVATSDSTARDLTFGTGITGPALTGVISKTKVQSFVYNGSAFIASAAPVQTD